MLAAATVAVVSCEKPEPEQQPEDPQEKPEDKPAEPALAVSQETFDLAAEASEATFTITTNQDWTATASETWVTLNPASGTASEQAVTVKVAIAANEAHEARTATITVTAAQLTKTVTITQAGKEVTEDGTEAKPWLIKTAADLVAMRAKAVEGATTYFRMEADVDMTGVTDYVPVNCGDTVGEGDAAVTTFNRQINFDGNFKTISNFACAHAAYPSLFGVLWGTVKNLTVTGATITAEGPCGIIGGYAGTVQNDIPMPAVLENVNAAGTITTTGDRAGGLAGVGYNVTATNCTSDVTITCALTDNGGLFGKLQGENVLTGCKTKSIINNANEKNARTGSLVGWNQATKTTVTDCHVLEGSTLTVTKPSNVSGFIAFADNENLNTVLTITNCSSKAAVTSEGAANVAGLIACVGYAGTTVEITNSFAEGTIVSTQNYSGGLIGRVNAGVVTIEKCYYKGTQSGRAGAGGIVGGAEGGEVVIKKSYASGTLTINASGNQGGILGLLNANAKATIENCWSDVAITIPSGSQHAGGIIGCANGTAVIKNSFAKGDIFGSRGIGGLVGHLKGKNAEISGSIAWNATISGDRAITNWACGAIIGAVHTDGKGTFKNCWRRADMNLVDVAMKLVDHDDILDGRPPYPEYAPSDNTQNAYHGKAAAADATLSSVAKSIGWDENIWDLSGAVPVLK